MNALAWMCDLTPAFKAHARMTPPLPKFDPRPPARTLPPNELRVRAMAVLLDGPRSTVGLAAPLARDRRTVMATMRSAERAGLVMEDGHEVAQGRAAIVWTLTPRGRTEAQRAKEAA